MTEKPRYVPQDKFDLDAVHQAKELGFPGLNPHLPALLDWTQDMNWPVAPEVTRLLSGASLEIVPHLKGVLRGTDGAWKYWIMSDLIPVLGGDIQRALLSDVQRLATAPTSVDRHEEVDLAAHTALRVMARSTDPHPSGDIMPHCFTCRVYYEDTDLAGIVYYANYFKYIERARTEFIREMGVDQGQLKAQEGVVFAVRRVEADYVQPAQFDDVLRVETSVQSVSGARIVLNQVVLRDDATLFISSVTLAALKTDGKPARLPKDLRTRLQHA